MIQASDLLTPDELCARLKVKRSWVTQKTRRRCPDRIPYLRIGKYIRFSWPQIAAWLESTSTVTPPTPRKKKVA